MPKLYTAQVCPFAHRARLALALKEVPHEREEIDLQSMPDWYRKLSPNESVPLLIHEDRKIWESLVVAEYVDEAFEGPALKPQDPYGRARMRIAIETISSSFVSKAGAAMHPKNGKVPELKQNEIWPKLVETMLDGPFWLGSQPTLADIACYTFVERWPLVEHNTGQALQMPERLDTWLQAMRDLPAVQKEMAPPSFYLDSFAAASRQS